MASTRSRSQVLAALHRGGETGLSMSELTRMTQLCPQTVRSALDELRAVLHRRRWYIDAPLSEARAVVAGLSPVNGSSATLCLWWGRTTPPRFVWCELDEAPTPKALQAGRLGRWLRRQPNSARRALEQVVASRFQASLDVSAGSRPLRSQFPGEVEVCARSGHPRALPAPADPPPGLVGEPGSPREPVRGMRPTTLRALLLAFEGKPADAGELDRLRRWGFVSNGFPNEAGLEELRAHGLIAQGERRPDPSVRALADASRSPGPDPSADVERDLSSSANGDTDSDADTRPLPPNAASFTPAQRKVWDYLASKDEGIRISEIHSACGGARVTVRRALTSIGAVCVGMGRGARWILPG